MENLDLFLEILSIDSSSSREKMLSDFLAGRFKTEKNTLRRFPVGVSEENPDGDGTENLLFCWGEPRVVFCTHLDTVPPYFPPAVSVEAPCADGREHLKVTGRGSCDANGQIIAMFNACLALEKKGCTDFALLLLAGEEVGSYGAKSFSRAVNSGEIKLPEGAYVIVGEPTGNAMVSACKGTKSFEVTFRGKSCHSGYPENGESAVDMFVDFVNALRSVEFPEDPLLGKTTWNIGRLSSANPQNILSPSLGFRIYFRTTFVSDGIVENLMRNMAGEEAVLRFGASVPGKCRDEVASWQKGMSVKAFGGDTPMEYTVFPGFETTPAAFGSDAPQLAGFSHRSLCGPGSILVAHTMDEFVRVDDLEKATAQYIRMYEEASK